MPANTPIQPREIKAADRTYPCPPCCLEVLSQLFLFFPVSPPLCSSCDKSMEEWMSGKDTFTTLDYSHDKYCKVWQESN